MASGVAGNHSSQPQDVVHRLVRTLSGKSDPPSAVALQRSSSAASQKRRLSISERLKSIGRDIGKLSKKNNGRSAEVSSVPTTPTTPRISLAEPGPSRLDTPAVRSRNHVQDLSMVAEEAGATNSTGNTTPRGDDTPEPTFLARKIQALIDSLPSSNPPPDSPPRRKPIPKPQPPKRDKNGRPIPPPDATPVKDSRLLSFLQSATIMNGGKAGQDRGEGRQSIWSILESLGAPKHEEERQDGDEENGGEDEGGSVFSDGASVMVYSPLIPTKEDLVELAESVPVTVEEVDVREDANAGQKSGMTSLLSGWTTFWPFSAWYGQVQKDEEQQTTAATPAVETEEARQEVDAVRQRTISNTSQHRVARTQTQQLWVPSRTKLSVQAMWWGYRLYLPPPIMDILSDKQLEATKRAAMITTALTWFFNNLPLSALPAAVRPAVMLLQGIAPYLGYIGTFISWSWSTIKSYDLGYGVILTATWLLPVALIPGTWYEADFPQSPSAGSPTPLPPAPLPAPAPSNPSPAPSTPGTLDPATPVPPSSPPTQPTAPLATLPITTPESPISPTSIPLPISPPTLSSPLGPSTPALIPSARLPSSPAPAFRPMSSVFSPSSFAPAVLSSPRSPPSRSLLLFRTPKPSAMALPITPPYESSPLPPIPQQAQVLSSSPITTYSPSQMPTSPQQRTYSPPTHSPPVPMNSPLVPMLLQSPEIPMVALPEDDAEKRDRKDARKKRKLFGLGKQ
ncbi:hypothetical protein BDQ12DRAFT_708087 [Crucibulum laeve]|uniref:Uncharacterized protein n=1 Tax=Crucibulum laeve TaxID=68775 RepID=A0A5C3MF58_9AGAR|nr:hypothetical protein BDQ12DRAFT_708087 [Crucibulum laeve]